MKVLGLKAENILNLKAVNLRVEGKDSVVISGKNGQGKTSVLESIWYALGGSKNIPEKPVRKGQEEGEIQLDLGEYIVTRTFTKGGENTYLKVENKEGNSFNSPQSLLDDLLGKISFNPLDIMDDKKRDDILLDIAGIRDDLEELEEERQEIYDDRRIVNREVKKLKGQLDGLGEPEKAEIISISETSEQLNKVRKIKQDIKSDKDNISSTKHKIKQLEEQIKEEKETLNALKSDIGSLEETLLDLPSEDVLEERINKAEDKNEEARKYEKYKEVKKEYENKKSESEEYTDKINELDDKKEEVIENSDFPFSNMGYEDGMVTVNGVPLEQLAHSEKILVGTKIQMALNPKLRVILIPDASLLDEDNFNKMNNWAKERDYQIWIEKVASKDDKVGIYIEEGEVKEV